MDTIFTYTAYIFIILSVTYFIIWIYEYFKNNNKLLSNILGKKEKYIEISALLMTVSFLIFYTLETNKLRKISENQLELSKKQLESSKKVYKDTIEQLIENNKPVIIPKAFIKNAIVLKNSSNFNAFNVKIKQYIGTGTINCYIGFIDSRKQITNYFDLCEKSIMKIKELGGIGLTKKICIEYENSNGLIFNSTGESTGYIRDIQNGNIIERTSNIHDGIDYLDDFYELKKQHESQYGKIGRLGKFEQIKASRGKCN